MTPVRKTDICPKFFRLLAFLEGKKAEKLVKVVSAAVPADILPFEESVTLRDVRVFGYGPDDEIYNKNKDLLQKVSILGTWDWWF